MDRTSVDSSDVSVALANLTSTSGADWANRDREALYRRPPAVNSFRDDADEEDMADSPSWSAFGSPGSSSAADGPAAADPPEPAYGPAPPAGPGRASFGFTAGPISGNHIAGRSEQTSGVPFLPPLTGPAPHQPATGSTTGEQAAYPRAVGDRVMYPRTARSATGERPAYAPAAFSPAAPAPTASTPTAFSPACGERTPFPQEGRTVTGEQAAYSDAGHSWTGELALYPASGRSGTRQTIRAACRETA